MANIPKAILDLLTNSKTAKFAESLKHSDLPANWADDPEIVDLAARAWKEAGTDSPFFKAWFGNSTVVDDAGKPLKTYHQTGENFDVFDLSKARQDSDLPAFYFSDGLDDWAGMGDNVIPAYLKIESPANKPIARGRGREVRERLEKEGTDGTILRDLDESPETEWAAFNPTQIKSVNNRGTFNPADPNIMRTVAPLGVGTAAMAAALLGDGSEAEAAPAWRPPEEPGLEEPWWSPADLFVAPVGVAGKIPAKLLAMAADAPATIGISSALEKLFGK